MTTRDEFEAWASNNGYTSYLKRKKNESYFYSMTVRGWDVWQARQQEIDALKAEIERLKQAASQDALDAGRYRFLKKNLVGGFDLPGLYSLDVIDHESWDATIDESMEYTTGSGHE